MFGMAGGAAGQFVVGPWIGQGLQWNVFWTAMGVGGLVIGVLLFVLLPKDAPQKLKGSWFDSASAAFSIVFRNPQSILCGLHRRFDIHADNHLRHDMGCPLSPGGARPGIRRRRGALGRGSVWMDHRLSVAGIYIGSNRKTKTSDPRCKCGVVCLVSPGSSTAQRTFSLLM